MNRKDKLVSGLDLRNQVGVEIGALDNPIVRRVDGEIIYVDYMTTEALREKYANDPNVNAANIVSVDAICHQTTMANAIGVDNKVDYIIASHVIEHVPDLISWLEELRVVLKPGGEIRLAIPDKRFTFDYLRSETRLSDVVNAYLLQAKAPLPHSIIDCCYNMAKVDAVKAWTGQLDATRLEKYHQPDGALNVARDALNGAYHDVHCWVFTPHSLSVLLEQVATLGLLNFSCAGFYDTEQYQVEFFVTLRECSDRAQIIESWKELQGRQLIEAL